MASNTMTRAADVSFQPFDEASDVIDEQDANKQACLIGLDAFVEPLVALGYTDEDLVKFLRMRGALQVDMDKFADVLVDEDPTEEETHAFAELLDRMQKQATVLATEFRKFRVPDELLHRMASASRNTDDDTELGMTRDDDSGSGIRRGPTDRWIRRGPTQPFVGRDSTGTIGVSEKRATLKPVVADDKIVSEVRDDLRVYIEDMKVDVEIGLKTATVVTDIMHKGTGGAIVAVVEGSLWDKIRFNHLDGGLLTKLFANVAPNLHKNTESFKTLFGKFTEHSHSDRWSDADVCELQNMLNKSLSSHADEQLTKEELATIEGMPMLNKSESSHADEQLTKEELATIEGMPKDGAVVLSLKGTVIGAAGHLKYSSFDFKLKRHDGTLAGTRHNSSLAFAQWLGRHDAAGFIFVRSDDGGVHVMLPDREHSKNQPKLYHFPNIRPAKQEEMLELFKKKIKDKGRKMIKKTTAFARNGKKGERIVTWTNETVIADVVVRDEKQWVVRSSSVDHENYVLDEDKFARNWQVPSAEILGDNPSAVDDPSAKAELEILKERGYKRFHPARKAKSFYQVTEKDLELLDEKNLERCFINFGSKQPLDVHDNLALGHAEDHIYLMPQHILSTNYKEAEDN